MHPVPIDRPEGSLFPHSDSGAGIGGVGTTHFEAGWFGRMGVQGRPDGL